MPVITISEQEKRALQDYVDNITTYIDSQYASDFPDGRLPPTAKISRIRPDTNGNPTRYVQFAQATLEETPRPSIPLNHLHPEDELLKSHSCTVGETPDEFYFHRNIDDFPSERPDNMSEATYEGYKKNMVALNKLEKKVTDIESKMSSEEIKRMQEYNHKRQQLDAYYKRYPQLRNKTELEFQNYLIDLNERDEKILSKTPLEYGKNQTNFLDFDGILLDHREYPDLMDRLEKIKEYEEDFKYSEALLDERNRMAWNQSLEQLNNNVTYKALENELVRHYEKYADDYAQYFDDINPITDPLIKLQNEQDVVTTLSDELDAYLNFLNEKKAILAGNPSPEELKTDGGYQKIEEALMVYDDKYFHGANIRPENEKMELERNKSTIISTHRQNFNNYQKALNKQHELILTHSAAELASEHQGLEEILVDFRKLYSVWTNLNCDYLDLMADKTKQNCPWEGLKDEKDELEEDIGNYLTRKDEALLHNRLQSEIASYESERSQAQLKREAEYCQYLENFYPNAAPFGEKGKKPQTQYARTHHYVFENTSVTKSSIFKHHVKYAVDKHGNLFVINRKESNQTEHIGTYPDIRQEKEFGFFRLSRNGVMKRVEFQPYRGNSLLNFLYATKKDIPDEKKNKIAHAVLETYIEEVFSENIVHTDLSIGNICIKMIGEDIKLSIIDWHEAFYDTPENKVKKTKGKGSRGFLAPELFKNEQDYKQQLDVAMPTLIEMLKPLGSRDFSPATDIYALGCLLIDHLKLSSESPYYELANKMKNPILEERATGEDIQSFLTQLNVTKLTL